MVCFDVSEIGQSHLNVLNMLVGIALTALPKVTFHVVLRCLDVVAAPNKFKQPNGLRPVQGINLVVE